MSAPEYTPTREQVRFAFERLWQADFGNREASAAAFDRWLAKHDAEVKAEALRKAADEHEQELVCCDVYDRKRRGERVEPADNHHICYWGAACAEGDRLRADHIEAAS